MIEKVIFFMNQFEPKVAEELDLEEQTAQDYSIVVNDPSPEVVDPDVWKVCRCAPEPREYERVFFFNFVPCF